VSPLIITGTGTGVGKTITTAAVAALARARGERVAVVKPAQTGEPPGEPPAAPGDLAVVHTLTGLDDLHELARYPDPLSPEAAARTARQPPLDLRRAADYVAALAEDRDLVLVEGAGGLLVRYDPAGTTIADLAAMLGAPVLVVTAAGLGTLNHTALTLEALATRKLACAGVVIGSWPAEPGLAELCNLTDLAALAGQPVAGLLPAGAGDLEPAAFTEVAVHGLGPALGGSLDVTAYRAQAAGPGRRRGQQTIDDL
jgi:dethiobiotin synthetase